MTNDKVTKQRSKEVNNPIMIAPQKIDGMKDQIWFQVGKKNATHSSTLTPT
jgi:hypothetical protein